MKFEFSAGGIVFQTANAKIEILMVQHGGYSHHWGFPKGHIGDHIKGESKEVAALREVKEETGINAEILRELRPIEYWYNYEKEKRKKTVYFFIMKALGGSFAEKDQEMQRVEWVPLVNVLQTLTYDSEKKLFQDSVLLIEELVKSEIIEV